MSELLARKFIENSPDFFSDLAIDEIDDKHSAIVKSAYNKMDEKSFWNKFREWSGQDEGVAPVDFFVDVIGSRSSFKNILRYFFIKLFKYKRESIYRSSLADDIDAIKIVGGERLLEENKISDTPGNARYCHISNYQVNTRFLRYIYILSQINKYKLLNDDSIWIDVGPFYGGLQGYVKKYYKNSRMILVDFHHQLCRSYIYLKTIYPNSNHIFPNEIKQFHDLEKLPKDSFFYVPVNYFDKIKSSNLDLFTNFYSLGEMRREHFLNYMSSSIFKNSKYRYLINRFVSAPFFEKTYDSDINVIDYLKFNDNPIYFDVFPIHHFQQFKRNLYGRNVFRNTSSSYFELISSNN